MTAPAPPRPSATAPVAPHLPPAPSTVRGDLSRSALPAIDRPHAELAVLDITKWYGETSGGVRTYLTEKARYVEARPSLRQVLVVPGPFDRCDVGCGVRTYRLRGPLIPTQTAYRFLFATRTTRRLIEHERPDLIEVGSPFFVPWLTALATRRTRTPLVGFHHSSLPTLPRSLGLGPIAAQGLTRLTGAYLRQLNRLFRTTVVASDYARRDLGARGIERVRHIPLGVDLAHFHPARAHNRAETRARFRLPSDRPVAMYVGRLAREKRLEVVIDGWGEVARRTGAVLAVAGAGSEEWGLRARARARNVDVAWLPYQGDRETVAALHGAADLYVSPGEWETFGLSALEAMATGIPVVTPASGAGWELVERAGAGRGFEPGSPSDMARAVVDVLGTTDNSQGLAGRRHAEQEHGWSTVFDRLFTLYREVVAA